MHDRVLGVCHYAMWHNVIEEIYQWVLSSKKWLPEQRLLGALFGMEQPTELQMAVAAEQGLPTGQYRSSAQRRSDFWRGSWVGRPSQDAEAPERKEAAAVAREETDRTLRIAKILATRRPGLRQP